MTVATNIISIIVTEIVAPTIAKTVGITLAGNWRGS